VLRGGAPVGYYYAANGRIGPVAWLDARDGELVLTAAVAEASAQGGPVKIVIPGMNHTALGLALRAGLRLERSSHLLWTGPFGRLEQYIPSGPLLF